MISKNDILKFVRHVHKRGRGVPDRRPMHPRREWLVGLFLFLVTTGIGAVLSMLTFEYYKNVDQRTYTADLTAPTFNEQRAQTVLEAMALRKENYERLTGKGGAAPVVQPVDDTATSTSETDEDEEDGSEDEETVAAETIEEEVGENNEVVESDAGDELEEVEAETAVEPEEGEEDDPEEADSSGGGAVLDAS